MSDSDSEKPDEQASQSNSSNGSPKNDEDTPVSSSADSVEKEPHPKGISSDEPDAQKLAGKDIKHKKDGKGSKPERMVSFFKQFKFSGKRNGRWIVCEWKTIRAWSSTQKTEFFWLGSSFLCIINFADFQLLLLLFYFTACRYRSEG